ncbi:MAG TPA: T9SS type A sorting domain-containing protein, partial [Bacteroidales bacterium]|nr:T9SS type A sorting domain-containing protein [Bacteroidales bacterium]
PDFLSTGYHNIALQVTDTNGCQNSDTLEVLAEPCTGIAESEESPDIALWPNPSPSGVFYLSIPDQLTRAQLRIFNSSGQLIENKQYSTLLPGVFTVILPVSNKGVYHLNLLHDKGLESFRLVIP